MPFDAEGHQPSAVDVLDTLEQRLRSGYYRWVRIEHGDNLNDYLPPHDACLMDALRDVCPCGHEQPLAFLAAAIIDCPPGEPDGEDEILVEEWNDEHGRTFEEVCGIIRIAKASALEWAISQQQLELDLDA